MLLSSSTTNFNETDKIALMLRESMRLASLFVVAILSLSVASPAYQGDSAVTTGVKTLTASEAAKLLPAAVYFRGQSAPIQARNSGGVQFTKDSFLLATLVDTAGYSSSVQEKYQAYLVTEEPIDIEGHRLQPGAYGCGFVAGNTFVIMDI